MGAALHVNPAELLLEISEVHPSGEAPFPSESEFEKLSNAGDWGGILENSCEQLKGTTKDLDLAKWLTQALMQLKGFAGAVSGLPILLELLKTYWDKGLHPLDLGDRSVSLRWLNREFAAILEGLPITSGGKEEPSYSYMQYLRSVELERNAADSEYVNRKKQEGWITRGIWVAAEDKTSPDFYASLRDILAQITDNHGQIETFIGTKLKNPPKFYEARKVLNDLGELIDAIYLRKRPASDIRGTASRGGKADEHLGVAKNALEGARPPSLIEELEEIGRSAGSESAGRDRFFRKLQIAKLYIGDQHNLAKIILEDLAREIEDRKLEEWENSSVLAEIWSLLYQCRRRSKDADGAQKLLDKLCRFAPWAALGAEG